MQAGLVRIANSSGLAFEVDANGCVRRIDRGDVMLNAFLANELEGGASNLYLRRRDGRITWTPLLGPRGPGEVARGEQGLDVHGEWEGIRFRVSLRLAADAPAWFWHVLLENARPEALALDLIHAQDLALADYGMLRNNEYYVSQYVDHAPLAHPARGVVLASRQNLPIGGRHPWSLLGSLGRATSFATDALDFYGIDARRSGVPAALEAPRLPGRRLQHEHSLAVLQEAEFTLAPGERAARGFFGWLEADHADASSPADLAFVERALALPESAAAPARAAAGAAPARSLFSSRPLFAARELDDDDLATCFGPERRAQERDGDRVLSFFHGAAAHVVLPAKERASLRPHGQILRSGDALVPDEASLTSTVWMGGVFHSMLTQGHVSIDRLLSTTHGYLGLFRSHGLRVFVSQDGGYALLDQPSAFEMTPSAARWIYRHARGLFEVRSRAAVGRHEMGLEIEVLDGAPLRFLISNHLAVNGDDGSQAIPARCERDAQGIEVGLLPDTDLGRRFPDGGFRFDPAPGTTFERVGGDELLFEDGRSRGLPFLVLESEPTRALGLRITGRLVAGEPTAARAREDDAAEADRFALRATGSLDLRRGDDAPAQRAIAPLAEALPWFAHDALIHYLAPRGLEQYSGGGWGTRDVCQGPVELLLGQGRSEPVRDILLRVFRQQNPDGDWPQWFMFFERERGIRPGDSHGDIVFWPLLALGQYLLASDDASLLDEAVPFFHTEGDARAERATVLAHAERALELIARRVVPGTRLAAYGNGDWNDSMQPLDPALAERLCSAWTVTLHVQMLGTLAAGLRRVGRGELARALEARLPGIRDDFQRLLVADGVVAGLAHFREDGRVEHWLHPRDREGGISYSLLPMVHAILAELFTREQADRHLEVIRRELLGADGARLFDRPLPYRGGLQRRFQRAETATFFGREIGLMYTHAHLRYAEALARVGDAEAFFLALRQACPVGLREVVKSARLRQANCYTSSSDAAFADRYEAAARYGDVRSGSVAFEGGWRVYSSGAGIALRLVRECLLGVRLSRARLELDPVLPRALDGLRASAEIDGRRVELCYRVGTRGYAPQALRLGGRALPFAREANPYREGGVSVAMDALREGLRDATALEIEVG